MRTYDVGGIELPRPFQIRRFGHFGYNCEQLDEALHFYTDVLGFRVTDICNLFDSVPPVVRTKAERVVTDSRMYFTSHGSDHHALLLAHKTFGTFNRNDRFAPDNTLSQITWQVGSLAEVVEATDYLRDLGVRVGRVGRDMPGGNWHVYFLDPDGNTLELYYGMEQIGWNRRSRPRSMHYRGFGEQPTLPQMSEWAEVREALDKRGLDIDAGWHPDESHLEASYDVAGILLPRPFKITKLGPISMFTDEHAAMVDFYQSVMGFTITETTQVLGHQVVYLRHGVEHHSLVLAEKGLRAALGLSEHTSNLAMGMEVSSYRQLRDAVAYLQAAGYEQRNLATGLHLGIDVAAHFTDPDGHLVQLYYYMENIGWDGRPRPPAERRAWDGSWPETLPPLSDTYVDQTFMGPLG